MKAIFCIEPHKITRSLVIITLMLTALSLLEQGLGLTSGLFYLGTDASLPTWYASLALLFSALLLSLIATKKRNQPYAAHWQWLAIIFYGLSIDEVAVIHERVGDAFASTSLDDTLTQLLAFTRLPEGFFHYSWVLLAIPVMSIFFLSYLRFVLRLPQQTKVLFILAAFIFLTGAMGLETFAGYQSYLSGNKTWAYILLTHVEEFLEKVGIIIFIHALLQYISTHLGRVELILEEKKRF
ncbi:MAG: hypothetical protein AAFO06_07045 [Cyanobacteria bacterium J06597_16]